MYVCDYSDRLKIVKGEVVRIVTAYPKRKAESHRKLDIYREWENGDSECRNLYYNGYSGYRVAFPKDVVSLYNNGTCTFEQNLEKWGDASTVKVFRWYSDIISEKDRAVILSKYPEFKWVLNKWKSTLAKTMIALRIWKEHKEVEFLLSAGFECVALNLRFWKQTEKKRKEIVNYIRTHESSKRLNLSEIQTILKYKLSEEEYAEYHHFCFIYSKVRYDVYKYLKKIGQLNSRTVFLYRDYYKMLKESTHDIKSEYWLYPKDLQKKHDELREEINRIKELVAIEKLKIKQEKYSKAVKKWLKYKMDIDGYCVYVPETVEEIKEQADVLHQCLIACDYVSDVINKKCVLVFIRKNGKPIATAQLFKGNKIGQFYADEHDRGNCLPSPKVKAVMNKWLELKEVA
ncbi:PcfJ-like protein [Treponema bryantii]|uniref:PcfJ-like protein n=1 Tax=Treponema bryantii TaxID=163 RepID=A0A1H9B2X1_9SPIR|nr:PcfJ domain-containing protein [Treponema bryantii]SEP83382.1 PcfJ-like protein [Treponema bryantii]